MPSETIAAGNSYAANEAKVENLFAVSTAMNRELKRTQTARELALRHWMHSGAS